MQLCSSTVNKLLKLTDCGTGCSTIQTTDDPWQNGPGQLTANQKCLINLGISPISIGDFHASINYASSVTNVVVSGLLIFTVKDF